ncbi:DUF1254 domain-containing protein [Herbiconiux ginsengi]|uniref:Carboxylesterase n=1 Tax=Herbiconiux ginsengi TaxID=381665 RepID=A0A1H3S2R4_9MICO|nr:DUF1254 domain-containing protein [Herbiconiux ginsengi]SDZ31771.1 Protein of unknown function [Herbiconiux ginsengi]
MTAEPIIVTVENFVRAETDRMFAGLAAAAGGSNRWRHVREPAPLDEQTVVRLNRDTLYSSAIVDISNGATITIPDAGSRYLSVMIVNQDHYINDVLHEPGDHELTVDKYDTPWVLVAVRTLVDPDDPADVAAVARVQDSLGLAVDSDASFTAPAYDTASLDAVRQSLLDLGRGIKDFSGTFGRAADVDPVKHLIGTATGWGGLPASEAFYVNVDPGLPVADFELTARDVPVDAFWSVTVYNADGYLEPNEKGVNSINSITGVTNDDGSITVRFGSGDAPNTIPIVEGWNYTVRLYRPHAEIIDGSWTFPQAVPR